VIMFHFKVLTVQMYSFAASVRIILILCNSHLYRSLKSRLSNLTYTCLKYACCVQKLCTISYGYSVIIKAAVIH
jgi:hypothetical protein